MTMRSGLLGVSLLPCMLLAVSCSRTEPQPPSCSCVVEESADEVAFEINLNQLSDYEEVDKEEDAELVFVVEVFIPALSLADEHRFYLRRTQPDPDHSRSHIPFYGWCGCGSSGGCSGSIGLGWKIPDAGKVDVSYSLHWSYIDGNEGKFEKRLEFPWFAESKQEFEGGIWARCYFVEIGT
jgi:hypothetical protein